MSDTESKQVLELTALAPYTYERYRVTNTHERYRVKAGVGIDGTRAPVLAELLLGLTYYRDGGVESVVPLLVIRAVLRVCGLTLLVYAALRSTPPRHPCSPAAAYTSSVRPHTLVA